MLRPPQMLGNNTMIRQSFLPSERRAVGPPSGQVSKDIYRKLPRLKFAETFADQSHPKIVTIIQVPT
jgi:hypothetical protein